MEATIFLCICILLCGIGWVKFREHAKMGLGVYFASPLMAYNNLSRVFAKEARIRDVWLNLLFSAACMVSIGFSVAVGFTSGSIGRGIFSYVLWCLFFSGIFAFLWGKSSASRSDILRGTTITDYNTAREQAAATVKPEDVARTIHIGGLPIMPEMETRHFAISGATGTGKSLAIKGMLNTVRARGQKAVISDPTGDYLSVFGRSNDLVLNLFDKRSVKWSPFKEIQSAYDCDRIAASVIPEGEGNAQFFNTNARNVLSTVMRSMWEKGEHSTHKLAYLCTGGNRLALKEYVEGTTVESLLLGEAGGAADSVRGTLGQYMQSWGYLPDVGDFSIREWVRTVDRNDDSWLFLPFSSDQKALLGGMICTALSMAFVEGLSLPVNPARRLWYVLDEVGTLGTIPNLTDMLDLVRKHGGVVTLGFQTVAQLRQHYGDNFADSLMAGTGTVLLLNPNDPNTAEWASKRIGQVQIRRMVQGTSHTSHPIMPTRTNTTSANEQITIEDAVMPSQLLALPSNQGYLKRTVFGAQGAAQDWAYVHVPILNFQPSAQNFVPSSEPIKYMAGLTKPNATPAAAAPAAAPAVPATFGTADASDRAAADAIVASWLA